MWRLSIVLLLTLLFACDKIPAGFTDIGEINRNPASYQGREVKISGTIVDVVKIPIVNRKFYEVLDESGKIKVFTEGPVLGVGQKVSLRGRVESAVMIGGTSFGHHVIELEQLPVLLK